MVNFKTFRDPAMLPVPMVIANNPQNFINQFNNNNVRNRIVNNAYPQANNQYVLHRNINRHRNP